MAFEQFKLDIATEQTRGIFNTYVYESDVDSVADIQVAGYFSDSRFIGDPDWIGSLMIAKMSDGSVNGFIGADGSITPEMPPTFESIIETSGPTYVMDGTEDVILCTGVVSIEMVPIASANKSFSANADGGTVTMIPDGTDTVQTVTIVDPNSGEFVPKPSVGVSGEWRDL